MVSFQILDACFAFIFCVYSICLFFSFGYRQVIKEKGAKKTLKRKLIIQLTKIGLQNKSTNDFVLKNVIVYFHGK